MCESAIKRLFGWSCSLVGADNKQTSATHKAIRATIQRLHAFADYDEWMSQFSDFSTRPDWLLNNSVVVEALEKSRRYALYLVADWSIGL